MFTYGAGHTIRTYVPRFNMVINDGEAGELIALSPNETILASYHGKEIILFNTTTLERVGEFHLTRTLLEWNLIQMDHSRNKQTIYCNTKESIKIIDMTSMEVLEDTVLVDDRFRDISWSAMENCWRSRK